MNLRSFLHHCGSRCGMLPFLALLLLSATGCQSERPSDVTVDELEALITEASDPDGAFRRAQCCIERQNIVEKRFWKDHYYTIETRYQKPGDYRFDIIEEKELKTGLLFKTDRLYAIDYQEGTVGEVEGIDISRYRTMLEISNPDTDYHEIFDAVDIAIVTLEDEDESGDTVDREYYKLTCRLKGKPEAPPFEMYFDRKEHLLRRVHAYFLDADGERQEYVARILQYAKMFNVLLPVYMEVTEGETEYSSRVIFYQLDPVMPEDTFEVPTFDRLELLQKQMKKKR